MGSDSLEINFWWLPDFHVVAADSIVTLDLQPGGRGLCEEQADGAVLQWYSVQMYLPQQFSLYLVGYVAPDWGGPTVSHLKLSVNEGDKGCLLRVTDADKA